MDIRDVHFDYFIFFSYYTLSKIEYSSLNFPPPSLHESPGVLCKERLLWQIWMNSLTLTARELIINQLLCAKFKESPSGNYRGFSYLLFLSFTVTNHSNSDPHISDPNPRWKPEYTVDISTKSNSNIKQYKYSGIRLTMG